MIPVAAALRHLFELAAPLDVEEIPLREAQGRVLARDVAAARTQPPFAASAMDGYALQKAEAEPDAMFQVIGEAAAGRSFAGAVAAGQAVRIFTGAPLPQGADWVVIQEDVTRHGDVITLKRDLDVKSNIRPAGGDFSHGDVLAAPRRLGPAEISLLASMNVSRVPVTRRPHVAILATGDELVAPGETPGPDQIIASNNYGLAAQMTELGAHPRLLPIARDTVASLTAAFELAADADLILTIGGASVGDHDLVADVAARLGMEQSFHKVAMRPGKPLMSGRLRDVPMIGLPGNPVSALVCGTIFVAPVVKAMLGLGATPPARMQAPLAKPVGKNGPREHYMRAQLTPEGLEAFDRQDSSLLTVLADADALLIRSPHASAAEAGEIAEYIPI